MLTSSNNIVKVSLHTKLAIQNINAMKKCLGIVGRIGRYAMP